MQQIITYKGKICLHIEETISKSAVTSRLLPKKGSELYEKYRFRQFVESLPECDQAYFVKVLSSEIRKNPDNKSLYQHITIIEYPGKSLKHTIEKATAEGKKWDANFSTKVVRQLIYMNKILYDNKIIVTSAMNTSNMYMLDGQFKFAGYGLVGSKKSIYYRGYMVKQNLFTSVVEFHLNMHVINDGCAPGLTDEMCKANFDAIYRSEYINEIENGVRRIYSVINVEPNTHPKKVKEMRLVGYYMDTLWGIYDPVEFIKFWKQYMNIAGNFVCLVDRKDMIYFVEHFHDFDALLDYFSKKKKDLITV